ncbi:MAG: TetR/AcrR family transcriptional regulator [Elusimicrobia bacterium]|nr:TetR/AcrR family transcriptional regulator [Elusimicrobiota bacterium]
MDKRKRIIEKAGILISRKGYYEATMRDIAAQAGVAQGTPYLYFKNKEEMFIEIILSLLKDIDGIFEDSLSLAAGFWTRMENLIFRLGVYLQKHREIGNMIQAVINEPKGIGKKGRQKIKRMIDSRMEKFNSMFDSFTGKEKIKNYTKDEMTRFSGIVVEGVLKRILDGTEKDPRSTACFTVKCLRSAFGIK